MSVSYVRTCFWLVVFWIENRVTRKLIWPLVFPWRAFVDLCRIFHEGFTRIGKSSTLNPTILIEKQEDFECICCLSSHYWRVLKYVECYFSAAFMYISVNFSNSLGYIQYHNFFTNIYTLSNSRFDFYLGKLFNKAVPSNIYNMDKTFERFYFQLIRTVRPIVNWILLFFILSIKTMKIIESALILYRDQTFAFCNSSDFLYSDYFDFVQRPVFASVIHTWCLFRFSLFRLFNWFCTDQCWLLAINHSSPLFRLSGSMATSLFRQFDSIHIDFVQTIVCY